MVIIINMGGFLVGRLLSDQIGQDLHNTVNEQVQSPMHVTNYAWMTDEKTKYVKKNMISDSILQLNL